MKLQGQTMMFSPSLIYPTLLSSTIYQIFSALYYLSEQTKFKWTFYSIKVSVDPLFLYKLQMNQCTHILTSLYHNLKGSRSGGNKSNFLPARWTIWLAWEVELILVYIIVVEPIMSLPNPHASKNGLRKL